MILGLYSGIHGEQLGALVEHATNVSRNDMVMYSGVKGSTSGNSRNMFSSGVSDRSSSSLFGF